MNLLELKNVCLQFGGLTALTDVSLSVTKGSIFSVIGPNGAGKTSLFNVITGVYTPTSGEITLNGRAASRRVSVYTVLGIILIAILSSLGVFLSLHIEQLWELSITNLYVYQEPFPWEQAATTFLVNSWEIFLSGGYLYALLGALIGLLGASVVWHRGSRTPDVVARHGIARTFQNIRLFPQMTVRENVLLGLDRHLKTSALDALLRLPRMKREEISSESEVAKVLQLVGLESHADKPALSLPYGFQRRLEIARALVSRPEILLLDEPAAGMNPSEADNLIGVIKSIRDQGITILLIEHHMRVVMGISDRIAVLDYGHKIAEGPPEEVRNNPRVIAAYLGTVAENS